MTEGAKVLGVTRQALNNVVNGKSGISPEMAIRLSKAFGSRPKRGCGCNLPTISLPHVDEAKIKVRRQHVEELHIS